MNEPKIGDAVVFVDPVGVKHSAVVTAVWPQYGNPPGLNLVYASDDEAKSDTYGRQIERSTSVVHESKQAAHGMFWRV